MPEPDLTELAAELAELRDAVNTARAVFKGLQNQARIAVRLTLDLDERLGKFDSQLQLLQRQATEAKRNEQHHEETEPGRPQGISQLARAI